MFATPLLTLLAFSAAAVRADPNPINPGPGDVFIEGQSCAVGWDADTTGLWKNMSIELMTGDNFNMVYLTSSLEFHFLSGLLRGRRGVAVLFGC